MEKLFLSILLVCLSSFSSAQENWHFSLTSGSASADNIDGNPNNTVRFERDTVYQFVANHFDGVNTEGANLYYEFLLSKNNLLTDSSRNTDINIHSYHLQFGGAYEWSNWKTLRPYIAATVGTSYYDSKTQSGEPYFSGTFGVGGRYRLTPKLALKLEARAIGTILDGNVDVFCDDECSFGVGGDVWWQQHITAGFNWSF